MSEEEENNAIKLKELELDTHYRIKGLTDAFDNLKTFFEEFKRSVNSTIEKMEERLDRISMTLEQYMEKQEERNDKIWKRLNVITFLVMLQLFEVNINLQTLATSALFRFF